MNKIIALVSMLLMLSTHITHPHNGMGCCAPTPSTSPANTFIGSAHPQMAWLGTPVGFLIALLIIQPIARLWSDYISDNWKEYKEKRKAKKRGLVIDHHEEELCCNHSHSH